MSYEIRKPEIWFFHTVSEVSESGVPRLRLLPGQYIPDPSLPGAFIPGDENLNTQSNLKPRQVNPIGTIFATKFVELKTSSRGNHFLNVRQGSLAEDIISLSGGVTGDIKAAYAEYLKQVKGEKEEPVPTPVATATPGAISAIDKLMVENPVPTVAKDGFYVDKDVWRQLLFNIHMGYNTMLVGDSGTGKTELALLMGKRLGKKVSVFDMAAKQDPIASLIGVHRFDGKSVFDRADFTYALEEEGIVVLDELPRAPLNTNNILFPVLDSRRELNMDIASHGLRTIKVHEKCSFIATANEGFEYTGNTVLDRALKERFFPILINYMPESQEIALLTARTGVDKLYSAIIVKIARRIRDMRKAEEISSSVSIRHTLYAGALAQAGVHVNQAMEMAFLPMFTIDDEIKKIKDLLTSR
jgi:MoxR-like ATPase